MCATNHNIDLHIHNIPATVVAGQQSAIDLPRGRVLHAHQGALAEHGGNQAGLRLVAGVVRLEPGDL